MKLRKLTFSMLLLVVTLLTVNFVSAAESNLTISDIKFDIKNTVDGEFILNFKSSKEIDLSKENANIKIEYFTEAENGTLIPIKNKLEDDSPLVKDKTWAGYIWTASGSYSTGTDGYDQYSDIVPANTELATKLKRGVASDGDSMNYIDIDWTDTSVKYVVKITITDEFGNGESVIAKNYTDEVERTQIIGEEYSIYGFTNNTSQKEFIEGKEAEFNLGILANTIKEKGYASVKILATVTKPNGGELNITGINSNPFTLTKDYNESSIIKVTPNIYGEYKIKFDLVDLNNNSTVIATQTITLDVKEKSIIEKIQDSSSDKKAEINLINTTVVTAQAFQAAKENDVDVTFNVKNEDKVVYSWTFASNAINNVIDIDLGLNVGSSDKKSEIEKITKNEDVLYLSFTHHGELPAPATMKVFVGDKYSDGTIVKLYYYNEDTNQVELISKDIEVKDGYVTFTIEHCSDYFLEEQVASNINNPDTGDINVIALGSISILSIAGIIYLKFKK